MNSVVHFEMPFDDSQRAVKFYKEAFGWEASEMGPNMGNYVVVRTTASDSQTGRPENPGAINGGLYPRSQPDQSIKVVIAVDNIEDAMKKAVAAGGKLIGGSRGSDRPDDIPGVGLYMNIEDSEGNRVALLEPRGM